MLSWSTLVSTRIVGQQLKCALCKKPLSPSSSAWHPARVPVATSLVGVRLASGDVRVRFAPSPTGMLHLGGLRTALYNHLFARSQEGQFILRIEDTDQTRKVEGAMEKLVEMLEWVGIQIDEGPTQGGGRGPYIQSERKDIYTEHAQHLLKSGAAYHCFCTPQRLELLHKDARRRQQVPKYDNRCRHLTEGEVQENLAAGVPSVVRFKLESFTEPWHDLVFGAITYNVAQNEGDPVIVKSDGYPTYHLANVVDDHLMGITHILRGVEWQVSTPKHLLLYRAFGWEAPKIAHLPLIINKDGTKLSKRQNDIHVEYFKENGYLPETVVNLLTTTGSGFRVNNTQGMGMDLLVKHFDLDKVNSHSTRLDMARLQPINREHLRNRLKQSYHGNRREILQDVRDVITKQYSDRAVPSECLTDTYIQNVLEWMIRRIDTLKDLAKPEFEYIWTSPSNSELPSVDPKLKSVLNDTVTDLQDISPKDFCENVLSDKLKYRSSQTEVKKKEYMKALRTALSGLNKGPSISEMMTVLGKETTLARIRSAISPPS